MKRFIDELREDMLRSMEPRMATHGFKFNMPKKRFYINCSVGSAAIITSSVVHPGLDFDLIGNVGVRIDEVEDLVNESNSLATPKQRASTFTLGAEFGNMLNGAQMRWTIRDQRDIEPVVDSFVNTVEQVGIPYIEKHSDLKNAFEALAGNDPSHRLHSPSHGKRCQSALALASILQNPQRFEMVVKNSIAFLTLTNDHGLPAFLALAEKLSM